MSALSNRFAEVMGAGWSVVILLT